MEMQNSHKKILFKSKRPLGVKQEGQINLFNGLGSILS